MAATKSSKGLAASRRPTSLAVNVFHLALVTIVAAVLLFADLTPTNLSSPPESIPELDLRKRNDEQTITLTYPERVLASVCNKQAFNYNLNGYLVIVKEPVSGMDAAGVCRKIVKYESIASVTSNSQPYARGLMHAPAHVEPCTRMASKPTDTSERVGSIVNEPCDKSHAVICQNHKPLQELSMVYERQRHTSNFYNDEKCAEFRNAPYHTFVSVTANLFKPVVDNVKNIPLADLKFGAKRGIEHLQVALAHCRTRSPILTFDLLDTKATLNLTEKEFSIRKTDDGSTVINYNMEDIPMHDQARNILGAFITLRFNVTFPATQQAAVVPGVYNVSEDSTTGDKSFEFPHLTAKFSHNTTVMEALNEQMVLDGYLLIKMTDSDFPLFGFMAQDANTRGQSSLVKTSAELEWAARPLISWRNGLEEEISALNFEREGLWPAEDEMRRAFAIE